MRDEGRWIEPAIKVLLVVSAIGALVGIAVVAHFIVKFW